MLEHWTAKKEDVFLKLSDIRTLIETNLPYLKIESMTKELKLLEAGPDAVDSESPNGDESSDV